MKSKLLALVLLAGGSLFAGPRVFVGVGFGGGYVAPAPVPVVRPYIAPVPPPYWYRPAYVPPRPFVGAYWVAPRYYGSHYYRGYWRR